MLWGVNEFIVAEQASDLPVNMKAVALVLGNLDGVHLGHQELIRRAQAEKAPYTLAFTFDPHPLEILKAGGQFQRIFPRKAQIELLRRMGLDGVYFQSFTRSFSETSAEDFLIHLNQIFEPVLIVVGFNFRFGKDRRGTPELLKSWAAARQAAGQKIRIDVVEPVTQDGTSEGPVISSSEIRRALVAGDVKKARRLLGFPFFLETHVEEGAKRGRVIGFPTANMTWPSGILAPAFGVYATRAIVKGQVYPAISHLGPVPTFDDHRPRLETHILDQDLFLYGEDVVIEFLERIREPVKFDGLEALKAQIQKDIAVARGIHSHDLHS